MTIWGVEDGPGLKPIMFASFFRVEALRSLRKATTTTFSPGPSSDSQEGCEIGGGDFCLLACAEVFDGENA
jgi:hypothetical protein